MSEWDTKPLGELAAIRVSNVDKKSQASEHPVRLCNYMDVYAGTYLDDEVEYMEATASGREIANFSLQSGDVVITKDSESPDDIGIPALIDQTAGGLVCGYHLAMLRPDKSKIDPLFLLKQIETDAVRRFYLKRAAGSTRYALATKTIESTPIRLAPLEDQRIIARILRALDTQIEATEGLIAKQERVRAGLMQDLFTRGVDQHGQLRPPRVQAPHLYHQTELGWLPLGWEVVPMGNYIQRIDSGWSPNCDSEPAADDEWGVLKTTAVVWPGYDSSENKRHPDSVKQLPSVETKSGDILITRKGPMERVGVAVYVEATRPRLMFPDTVFRTRALPSETLLPRFLVAAMQSEAVQKHWWQRKVGLADAQVNINHGIVRNTPFQLPPRDEQGRILAAISTYEAIQRDYQRELPKLQSAKSGLMQDLLTGKVPVTPLLERALESVPA